MRTSVVNSPSTFCAVFALVSTNSHPNSRQRRALIMRHLALVLIVGLVSDQYEYWLLPLDSHYRLSKDPEPVEGSARCDRVDEDEAMTLSEGQP
jgi:hypothetical protein